ncbi:diguanylate cyclase [Marichromatium sp. AB31]|uniref:sensor domain-containing diguanylate cyclase n=1 Tax=Marichromatium sp. AB31 TaxID=2483362 RepID=UPI001CC1DC1F|nr:diguanylate cyclase [Marichromatium sp. AB31]
MNKGAMVMLGQASLRFERVLALIFALLGATIIAVSSVYWMFALEPLLREHYESQSRAFAQAQAPGLERLLDGTARPEYLRGELQAALDAILLLEDQSTGIAFIHRIELVLDYDMLDLPKGCLDMTRGDLGCESCVLVPIALYHPRDHLLIGVVRFYANPEFLQQLIAGVRGKLLWGAGTMLVLITLAWVGISRLLRRLGESESNLRNVFEAASFPMVLHEPGRRSLSRANEAARRYLALEGMAGDLSSEDWRYLLAAGLPSGDGEQREMCIPTEDGELRWALVSTVELRFSGGQGRLVSLVDVTRLKAIQEELRAASFTDGLTGLYNRRYLFSMLGKEVDMFHRYHQPLSIFLFDLDDFKKINDQYGHPVGDEVLVRVAEELRQCVREVDVIGRYGGEEFMVILPHAHLSAAREVAERIRVQVSALGWPQAGLRVTISGGVCEFNGVSVDAFVKLADDSLYRAKKAGKDQVLTDMSPTGVELLDQRPDIGGARQHGRDG